MAVRHQPAQPTRRGAYFALSIATLALVVNFWAWSLLSPLGSSYASELNLTPFMISLLLAVPVIIGSLGRVMVGMLTDVFGGRLMFAVLCLLTALPAFGLAFADTYQQIILVAVALGLGGTSFVIGIPYLSAWFPASRRGLVLGIYSVGNAGTALSGFATPRLAEALGRDATFAMVGSILVVVAVIFITLGKNSPSWSPAKTSPFVTFIAAAKSRITWDLSVIYVITFGAFVAFGVYLPVLLSVWYDLPLIDAASRAAGFILLATLARPFGGWLSDRLGGKFVVQLSLLAIVILSIFVAFQPTLHVHSTVAYLSLAFMLGIGSGAVFALVGKLARPEMMGSVSGLVGAAGGIGGFFPPLVLGLTYQHTSSYTPALVMLSVSALLVLIYIHHRFQDKRLYHKA